MPGLRPGNGQVGQESWRDTLAHQEELAIRVPQDVVAVTGSEGGIDSEVGPLRGADADAVMRHQFLRVAEPQWLVRPGPELTQGKIGRPAIVTRVFEAQVVTPQMMQQHETPVIQTIDGAATDRLLDDVPKIYEEWIL